MVYNKLTEIKVYYFFFFFFFFKILKIFNFFFFFFFFALMKYTIESQIIRKKAKKKEGNSYLY